jgi:uncharacterized protein
LTAILTELQALASSSTGLWFLVCVAVATVAQTLTGFAFGLVLLGLVAMFDLASVADAANASMVLTLVNACTYLRHQATPPPLKLMAPTLATSLLGVALGVAVLHWLHGQAAQALRGLLGLTIMGCALILVLRRGTRAQLSSPRSFAGIGLIAGVLSGLFSASGPPLVFHLYRQPLEPEVIRRCLLLVFAVNASFRLLLVVATGGFSVRALVLSALALPLVLLVTWAVQRQPWPMPARLLRGLVAGLLMLSGGSLTLMAALALRGPV